MSDNFNSLVPLLRAFPALLEDDQSVDIDNEISEACLISISHLVKRCPGQAKAHIPKIFETVSVAITYDPNYHDMGDDGDDQMQDYEDEGWASDYYNEDVDDDDDTAWKVRKSSVKVIDSLVNSCSNYL